MKLIIFYYRHDKKSINVWLEGFFDDLELFIILLADEHSSELSFFIITDGF